MYEDKKIENWNNFWSSGLSSLMGVSVAIMLVVFSAVHCAHDCVYCNYAGDFPL